jgi:hypothetical protein
VANLYTAQFAESEQKLLNRNMSGWFAPLSYRWSDRQIWQEKPGIYRILTRGRTVPGARRIGGGAGKYFRKSKFFV